MEMADLKTKMANIETLVSDLTTKLSYYENNYQ